MIRTLLKIVKHHEGFRRFPYKDTVGKLTIGYGFNLEDVGISEDEADAILFMRLMDLELRLSKFDWYYRQNDARRMALTDMAYNLGIEGLLKFKKMIKALEKGDYQKAAIEALDSKWANQVGRRAHTIASIIEDGKCNNIDL